MSAPEPVSKIPAGLPDLFREFADTAREQLEAAWQLHVMRVQEQLLSGWQREIEHVVQERFRDLSARIAEEFEATLKTRVAAEVSVAVPEACEAACRETSERLNQAARRLVRAESAEDWNTALLDATEGLCGRAVLFTVAGGQIQAVGARGVAPETTLAELCGKQVPLTGASAFAQVVETGDHVVAMRAPSELSESIAGWLGAAGEAKAYLFPISARQRVAAVLYADEEGPAVDAPALELMAAVAGAGLENVIARTTGRIPHLTPPEIPGLDWAGMTREAQELHLRAQRFARVQVAEMRLYKSQAVRSGRLNRNLYATLKDDIDAGREAFRRQFLAGSSSMVDYFHQELVRALANDDAALLGPDYPGTLV